MYVFLFCKGIQCCFNGWFDSWRKNVFTSFWSHISQYICIINSEYTVFDRLKRDQSSLVSRYMATVIMPGSLRGLCFWFGNVQDASHFSFVTMFVFFMGTYFYTMCHTEIAAILWNIMNILWNFGGFSAWIPLPKSPHFRACTVCHWRPWLHGCHEKNKSPWDGL